MPAVLSDAGSALLADQPAYYAEDPSAQAVAEATGRELARLEATARAVALSFIPTQADDVYGVLRVWEATMGLPIAPPGVPLSQRRAQVVARLRRRRAAHGRDWIALMQAALGTENWSHAELNPYTLAILIPQAEGSYTAEQALDLAREITPANLAITVVYNQGFTLGVSLLGLNTL